MSLAEQLELQTEQQKALKLFKTVNLINMWHNNLVLHICQVFNTHAAAFLFIYFVIFSTRVHAGRLALVQTPAALWWGVELGGGMWCYQFAITSTVSRDYYWPNMMYFWCIVLF